MATLIRSLPQHNSAIMQRSGSSERYHSVNSLPDNSRSPQKHPSPSMAGYRGQPGPAPAYAFTSTPQLGGLSSRQLHVQHPRSISASSLPPQLPQLDLGRSHNATQHSPQLAALPHFTPELFGRLALDDLDATSADTSLPAPISNTTVKPSPDRYRRAIRRTDSGEQTVTKNAGGQIYAQPNASGSFSTISPVSSDQVPSNTTAMQQRAVSRDGSQPTRSAPELASRYRRRSAGNIEVAGLNHTGDSQDMASPHPNSFVQSSPMSGDYMTARSAYRPNTSHAHTGSSDSLSSDRSGPPSRPSSSRHESSNAPAPMSAISNTRPDPRMSRTPARPQDAVRRNPSPLSNASPLSRPADSNFQGATTPDANMPNRRRPTTAKASSPAAEHLAALNLKEQKKPKSKLRRAFSFGSTAELRKATAQANHEKEVNASTKRNSNLEEDLESEQARIAQKQEEAGLGESIYSGQGRFFTGSTDNLSVSSTASSASIMLRKMGQGMKKGTRSFVGLFRPKSVLGVPAADGPVNAGSAAQVSMLTVEAEREKVNVNINPHDQAGGGTGFPRLERNSLDNKMSIDSSVVSYDSRSRRSIVGGELERAEVLAAVKKGILKKTDSNQSSPTLRPMDSKPPLTVPHACHMHDTPRSSAPSTPVDEPARTGHRRTDSIAIESGDHDDYFSQSDRYESLDSASNAPLTPQATSRNITFSPRIQFHDTWPSGEYDRRGEIATCNRLTPMLAQQIKEELNTFKMEMEVHESSKVYTHFF